jgi:RNA polymerase sigma-70 factor (ECF subfamily)
MTTGASFQQLLEEHRRLLFKVCRTFGHTAADRDDLAQEIAVQLWRSFPSFDGRVRFSTWMYRIALNVAISFTRRQRTRARYTIDSEAALLDVAEPATTPLELAELHARIAQLDPLDRALVLLYLDGYSNREVAEVLGTTEHNVATRLTRVRQTLRDITSTERTAS